MCDVGVILRYPLIHESDLYRPCSTPSVNEHRSLERITI